MSLIAFDRPFGGRHMGERGDLLMLGGWLLTLAVIALVAVFAIRAFRSRPALTHTPSPPPANPGGDNALNHVRLRYARGELTRDQFVQLTHDLGGFVDVGAPTTAPIATEPLPVTDPPA